MKEIKVFVYGTLQTGEHNHRVVERYVTAAEPGKVMGRLYSIGGAFPALVLGEKDSYEVEGEWLTIREGGLQETDRLEGYYGPFKQNFYDRVWISDINGANQGWVYVWKKVDGRPEIKSGSWKNRMKVAG